MKSKENPKDRKRRLDNRGHIQDAFLTILQIDGKDTVKKILDKKLSVAGGGIKENILEIASETAIANLSNDPWFKS